MAEEPRDDEFFVGGEMPIDHYAAVGRFIEAISNVEISLHLKFRELLGLPEKISRALIKEPGVARILDDIKLVVEQMDVELSMTFKTNFARLSAEIKEYNKIRSIIAHKPFMRTNTHFRYTGAFTAPDIDKIINYKCSISQLHAAADELGVIAAQIHILPVGRNPQFPPHEILKSISDQMAIERDLPPRVESSNKSSIRQSRDTFNKTVRYKHNK